MYQELSAKVDKVSYNVAMNMTMVLYIKCNNMYSWDPANVEKYKDCTRQISASNSEIKENIHNIELFFVNRPKEMSIQAELEQILEDIEIEPKSAKGTHSQNQNKPKSQNTSPNFGYVVQKC